MTASALNFKASDKGHIKGFFDLRYYGLTIKGVRLMTGPKGPWVALPQQKTEKAGEVKWVEVMSMTAPEMSHVTKMVLTDLAAQGVEV